MSQPNPVVDAFFSRAKKWQEELALLREIALSCALAEELKWGKPTYIAEGGNVVLLMPLKDSCALLFPKGALMKDPAGLLVQPGENSQSARQMRFTSATEIVSLKATLRRYLKEAIAVEKSGARVAFKKSTDLVYPQEFTLALDKSPRLREAFAALTPGRQRQYHIHFTGAKQAATRASRVEKAIPLILDGMGLND
jgi:uncharacterized protein YdeI (YjbR/CyaY-like superfamily)